MPFRFNQLLAEAGIDPAEVRLLRHQTNVPGRSLFDVWQADRALFEQYQSVQRSVNRTSFLRPWWAAFIGAWDGRTMFAGIYAAGDPVRVEQETALPITGEIIPAGTLDRYMVTLTEHLQPYIGRLYIDWGGGASGKRAWNQRAEVQDKLITEMHLEGAERPFPGYMAFTAPLSHIAEATPGWVQQLAAARGVYLLTCPRTSECYVGSAKGEGGFWSRWQSYAANGHGGNVALIGREPSDFIVSILQVAGSADSPDDIVAMEQVWKRKLQTRELGLNRN